MYHSCNDAAPGIMGFIMNTLFDSDEMERLAWKLMASEKKGINDKINMRKQYFLRYGYINQLLNRWQD